MPITTKAKSLNPAQARCTQYTNKTDRHNIAEILLKVVLNTITLTINIC